MPGEPGSPIDAQFADLNAAGMIDLCQSLADYAEAGSLSRDLMLRVGRYALARYADDLDVMLAVARMYQVGGELSRARASLLRAGRLAPNDGRVVHLLREVLRALGSQESPADLLAEAIDAPSSSRPTPMSPSRLPPRLSAPEPGREQGRELVETPRHKTVLPVRAVTDSARASSTSIAPAPPTHTSILPAPPAQASIVPAPLEGGRPSRAPLESVRPPRSNRIKLLEPDDPRRRLDPYELIGELAAGGMASIFLARLTGAGGFQRFVVIKRLHPHLAHTQEFTEMFLDEARLAAGIHHPHVVPILEIGQSDAGYYLVMEFIEGDTLATLTSRAFARGVMLPRGVVARIVFDALNGLHAAHQLKDAEGRLLGLVHRDCTPQNILVGTDGSSRLTDFGVARSASRYAITRSQVVKGKVAYLSPEQATGGELDRRSDLFSMGIVLWEALAGRPLFLSDHDAVTISRLLSQPIPSVRNFSPDVAPALDEVCGRALQRDVAMRFPTAAAMAEALERATRSAPGGLASPSEVTRCIEDLLGTEIAAQKESVRAWIAQQESTQASSRPSRTIEGRLSGTRAPDLKEPVLPPPPALPSDTNDRAEEAPLSDAASRREPVSLSAAPTSSSPEVSKEAATPSPLATSRTRIWIFLGALLALAVGSSPLWFTRLMHFFKK